MKSKEEINQELIRKSKKQPSPRFLCPSDVESFRQNLVKHICRDLMEYSVPVGYILRVLLARGVFKWFAVREDLIEAKDNWKIKIKETLGKMATAKERGDQYELIYQRGYLRGLEECRKEIRKMCHSKRWRAAKRDKEATLFLRWVESGYGINEIIKNIFQGQKDK